MLNIKEFIGGIISVIVGIVVVTKLGIPMITSSLIPTTGENVPENAGVINSILEMLPIFLVIVLLLAVAGMLWSFKSRD